MELYDKINNLKNSLDKEQKIIDIKNVQNEILMDENLRQKIYNKNYDNNNDLIMKYRHLENDINYIILEINNNLRKITKGDKDENNTR